MYNGSEIKWPWAQFEGVGEENWGQFLHSSNTKQSIPYSCQWWQHHPTTLHITKYNWDCSKPPSQITQHRSFFKNYEFLCYNNLLQWIFRAFTVSSQHSVATNIDILISCWKLLTFTSWYSNVTSSLQLYK